MNITIESSFRFSVSSIQYASSGELLITLTSENSHTDVQYRYTACLGDGQAEEKPSVRLLQYPMEYADIITAHCNTAYYNTNMVWESKKISLNGLFSVSLHFEIKTDNES